MAARIASIAALSSIAGGLCLTPSFRAYAASAAMTWSIILSRSRPPPRGPLRSSAGLPGWDGYLTLELLNVGPAPLRLYRGMAVARLVLFNLEGPVAHGSAHPFYGAGGHLGSRYADEFPADEYPR